MDPACRWRLAPLVVPTKVLVGGRVLIGEQVVIDCNDNPVAIFSSEALATVAVLAHNSAIEGALESLSRAQLLQHLEELQRKLNAVRAKAPVAHPPKAIILADLADAPKPRAFDGRKPIVYLLKNGSKGWSIGARIKSFTPMITDKGTPFYWTRGHKAYAKPSSKADRYPELDPAVKGTTVHEGPR